MRKNPKFGSFCTTYNICMKLRYQYRIYPNGQQVKQLAKQFGCCRVVWNDALARVKAVPQGERWPSNVQLQKLCITEAKKTEQRSWLVEVSNIPLQQSIADLGVAFKNFFESRSGKRQGRKVGFPRFKKKLNRQSARFRKGGFSLENNKVYLAKIGTIKTKWSRPLPSEPSSVTVIKDRAGRYFLSFVVDMESAIEPAQQAAVGVDLGIKTFATLSNGEKVAGPSYSLLNRQIRRAQRVLSRRQKGSRRRKRARLRVAKLKAKLRDIRRDFLHKLSTWLVRAYSVVALEDLNVSGMVKNRCLARAISEQGWAEFRALSESKADRYDSREVRVISRWEPTSQYCAGCGYHWGKLDLSVRELRCLGCGRQQDRDGNAGRNIRNVVLGQSETQNGQGATVRPGYPARCDELSTRLADRLSESAG